MLYRAYLLPLLFPSLLLGFLPSLRAEPAISYDLDEFSTAPWEVAQDDLINADSPSLKEVTGEAAGERGALTDGRAGGGTVGETDRADLMSYDSHEFTITYHLNTLEHPQGYDISEIRSYAGWTQWRVNQIYDVFITRVGSEREEHLISVDYTPIEQGQPEYIDCATRVATKDDSASALATGVQSIRFVFKADTKNSLSEAPRLGAMYRELDVIGAPSRKN